jgi:FkbM family methyltransferase
MTTDAQADLLAATLPATRPCSPLGGAPRMMRAGLRDTVLRTACVGLRFYFQNMPFAFGKQRLWNKVVRPYITWRHMEIEARTKFGARFRGHFPDLVHSFAYFFGVWEPAVSAVYQDTLKPGDVVVDIGANVGMHTLLAASLVGPTGRVHAIEASPAIFRRLEANLHHNGTTNVIAYNLAVTDVPGRVEVFVHDDTNLGGTTILAAEAARGVTGSTEIVEARPLGEIVPPEALRAARLIKIDVEGAEYLVVKGMRPLLAQLRPDVQILVEVKQTALQELGSSLDDFLALFAEAGFSPYEIANDYRGEIYIHRPDQRPSPLRRHDFEMADLLFRRDGADAQ